MTQRAVVESIARKSLARFVVTWQARLRTSTGADAPTFSAYADRLMHETGRTWSMEFDEERDQHVRRERCMVRESDVNTKLVAGDQCKDPAGLVWAVAACSSAGPGTRQYELTIDHPIVQGRQQGGMV